MDQFAALAYQPLLGFLGLVDSVEPIVDFGVELEEPVFGLRFRVKLCSTIRIGAEEHFFGLVGGYYFSASSAFILYRCQTVASSKK